MSQLLVNCLPEIADVSLSHATVTDILDRLEKRGLVQRNRSRCDKRRVIVEITDLGLELLQRAPPLLQERFVAEFTKLQDWEQAQILSTLQRVAALMEAEGIDASPILVSGPVSSTIPETPPEAKKTHLSKKERRKT